MHVRAEVTRFFNLPEQWIFRALVRIVRLAGRVRVDARRLSRADAVIPLLTWLCLNVG